MAPSKISKSHLARNDTLAESPTPSNFRPRCDVLFDPNRASCSVDCASSAVFSAAAATTKALSAVVNEASNAPLNCSNGTHNGTGFTDHHGHLDNGSDSFSHSGNDGDGDGSSLPYASSTSPSNTLNYPLPPPPSTQPSFTASCAASSTSGLPTTTTKYYLVKTTTTRPTTKASNEPPASNAPTQAPLLTPASTPPNRQTSASPVSSIPSSANGGSSEEWQCWIDQLLGEVQVEMEAEGTLHDPSTPTNSEHSGSQEPCAPKRSRSSSITAGTDSGNDSSDSSSPSTKRAKKYSLAALSQEEIALRKKEQNRVAAKRYRSRKTHTLEEGKVEIARLEGLNAQMRAEIEALAQEIAETKELLVADCLKAGGVVRE